MMKEMLSHAGSLAETMLAQDPLLAPFKQVLVRRIDKIIETESRLTCGKMMLADFASGHEFFGLHFTRNGWVFREWAPNAESIFFIGSMTGWKELPGFRMERTVPEGVWELWLPASAISHGDLFRLRVYWPGGAGDRIPAYARRVVQDPDTGIFNAQVWRPETPYDWKNPLPRRSTERPCGPAEEGLLLYEAHIGMAQEYEGIGSYAQFRDNVLPRIVRAGYNAIELMAIQEHPYYASFGYQVSSFFAASSRFGTPDDLKSLVDAAHEAGLLVIMDLIHSHAVKNETEGLGRFDGTDFQYFHAGPRGYHPAWDSRCFDYGKTEVLHFLLSNCRFWLDEYHFDGFRFDGVTSMLYKDHGLNRRFTSYADYFDDNVDEDALVYLALANRVVHQVAPRSITVAEDVSGMPGLALPVKDGGIGFDYRFAMGVPDYWIKIVKEHRDEDWHLGDLWFELTNRRAGEKSISYAESHDQALVGDQALIFRLAGSAMYDHMRIDDNNVDIDRAVALHKMIRLITLASAGDGYLNFMGNEFGHPEWIDFPREGNGWSFKHARRQWRLQDDPDLKYSLLSAFDRDMIYLARKFRLLSNPGLNLLIEDSEDKVIAFIRGPVMFIFNFHPTKSHTDYRIEAPPGKYRLCMNSDDMAYGGHGRLEKNQVYFTMPDEKCIEKNYLLVYLPTRTALVLEKKD